MGSSSVSIGVVGGRGYVGAELVRLLAGHSGFELVFVSSRSSAGQPVAEHFEGVDSQLCFEDLGADEVAERAADAIVIALPNGHAGAIVAAVEGRGYDPVIIDLGADYRFDESWVYGLPELGRAKLRGSRRIANPGCYATAMQLAIAPLGDLLAAPPHCFGVSGYSGAGTTPSPRNDLELLTGGISPYALTGHIHEAEVSRQLGQQIYFTPHVAPFFRGITMTASMALTEVGDVDQLAGRYRERFAGEALVALSEEVPRVQDHAGRHHATVGGLTLAADGLRVVTVAVLDNLLKGAATQALQNLNLACGLDELEGIRQWLD
jgi:N-acetyl-gamma-glutamyl-phosphate reductase